MGIKGLLRETRSLQKNVHISNFRNKSVAIDGYAWLHKALHHCSIEVALQKNISGIVQFFSKKIRYLVKELGITVVLVFDGDKLPLKKGTESGRESNREKYRQRAEKCYQEKDYEGAKKNYAIAIDVTPEMVFVLKSELERLFQVNLDKLEFIVAPYEADSQLAFLSITNYVDLIITEDSDLIPFGAKKILYKLDRNFYGDLYLKENRRFCEEFNFLQWSESKFLQLCIMAGCDYLDSIKGIGLKTAYNLLCKYNNIRGVLDSLKKKVDDDYYINFLSSYVAFRYSRVYCPISKKIVSLNHLDLNEIGLKNAFEYNALIQSREYHSSFDFLGLRFDPEKAYKIASCQIDPITKKAFEGRYGMKKNLSDKLTDSLQIVKY